VLLLTTTCATLRRAPAKRGRAALLPDTAAPQRLPDAAVPQRLADDFAPLCCSPDDALLHLSPAPAGRPWSHRQDLDLIAFHFSF
jgi:hypothetical protein